MHMHRTVNTDSVKGFSDHIPKEEVEMEKVEDITYKNGVLTTAQGETKCRLMPKVSYILLLHTKSQYLIHSFSKGKQ